MYVHMHEYYAWLHMQVYAEMHAFTRQLSTNALLCNEYPCGFEKQIYQKVTPLTLKYAEAKSLGKVNLMYISYLDEKRL